MRTRLMQCGFAVILTLILLLTPSAQAGDVLDFLPEVLLVRSLVLTNDFAVLDVDQCESVDIESPIPDHLIIDENGQFRTPDESKEIVLRINCLIQAAQTADLEMAAENTPLFISILGGEAVELSDGTVIDGTKQSVRASLALPMIILFQFDLIGGFFDLGLLPDDPCPFLRYLAISGSSLELRFVAFITLVTLQNPDNDFDIQCSRLIESDEQALIALTQGGDLDAAISLALLLGIAGAETFTDADPATDLSLILAERERVRLLILANTAKYPLLTLVYALPLLNLELLLAQGSE